jgi:hypothetical protein
MEQVQKATPKFKPGQRVMGFKGIPRFGIVEEVKWEGERDLSLLWYTYSLTDQNGEKVVIEESVLRLFDEAIFVEAWGLWLQVVSLREQTNVVLHQCVEMLRPGE